MPRTGRPPVRLKFREWCREVVSDPTVAENMKQKAREDHNFALKLAEHGYGRPPQGLEIRHGNIEGEGPLEFQITFDDGSAYSPPSEADITAPPTVPEEIP